MWWHDVVMILKNSSLFFLFAMNPRPCWVTSLGCFNAANGTPALCHIAWAWLHVRVIAIQFCHFFHH